nr:copper amine oxidase N-terminal domain-containing protein [Cohnella sp. CFH 77786]
MLAVAPGLAAAAGAAPQAAAAAERSVPSGYVPVRAIAEALGSKIEWEAAKRNITVSRDAAVLVMTLGSGQALLNGKPVKAGGVPVSVGDRAYVPLELLHTAFGGSFQWDEAAKELRFDKDDFAGLATAYLHRLYAGEYGKLAALMSPQLRQALSAPVLASISESYPKLYGSPAMRVSASVEKSGVHTNAKLVYATDGAPVQITVRFDRAGLVDDLEFTPYEPAPAY